MGMKIMNKKLQNLYEKYDIKNLPYGIVGDKLGDVYEDFIVEIFEDKNYIDNFEKLNSSNLEEKIFKTILENEGIENNNNILNIEATTDIPKRESGGNAKTDVLVKVIYKNGQVKEIPISVKQTTAPKVALAEFDVDTILKEVGINNELIERLMKKHQTDASAKNFTSQEKEQLSNELDKYKEKFLRWVITMSSVKNDSDIRIPKYVVRFQLTKGNYDISKMTVCDIDECINNMAGKKGGFRTGLSWTYATGSKGSKLQFKG
jgi:hypothetical protein